MVWIIFTPVIFYSATVILIWLSLKKSRSFTPVSKIPVKVSVIIPCKNEESDLKNIINDLLEQDYPADLTEIIIIDDHSDDNTLAVALSFSQPGNNLKVVPSTGFGKKSAVRTGAGISTGELIITTDADCRPVKTWISSVAAFHKDTGCDLVMGPVIIGDSSTGFFSRFQELEFLSLQGITAGTAAMGNPVMCNGANLAFTPSIYSKNVDNLHFESVSGDDVFLLHSVKKQKGSKAGYLDSVDALVRTSPSSSLKEFLEQRARWISKTKYYNDWFTIFLSIVTFVTILTIVVLFAVMFFRPAALFILAGQLVIKSIPDFLLLSEITRRLGRRGIMRWFIPSQLIYPLYVTGTVFQALFGKARW